MTLPNRKAGRNRLSCSRVADRDRLRSLAQGCASPLRNLVVDFGAMLAGSLIDPTFISSDIPLPLAPKSVPVEA